MNSYCKGLYGHLYEPYTFRILDQKFTLETKEGRWDIYIPGHIQAKMARDQIYDNDIIKAILYGELNQNGNTYIFRFRDPRGETIVVELFKGGKSTYRIFSVEKNIP
jgi:hypothetical protein